MRKRFVAGTVVVITLLALGLAAGAIHRAPWGHRWGGHGPEQMASRLLALLDNDRVKSELGLNDQQAGRLRQIIVDAEKSSIKAGGEMAVRSIDLRELLRADTPDRDAALKKVQEISNLRGEMMKHHVEALLAAKNVLTPEQQKKMRTFIEKQHGREFRGEHLGPHPLMPGRPPGPPREAPNPPEE